VVEASPPLLVVLPSVSVEDVDTVVVVSAVVDVQALRIRAHATIEARRRVTILRLSAPNR
jgi:hypothetical protein